MRILFFIVMGMASMAHAQTVAYWRFEDGAGGERVATTRPIRDVSGNGNDLHAASENTSPRYATTVPFATVPQTGQPNAGALDNTTPPAMRLPTRDLYTVHDDARAGSFDINTLPLAAWTIEASVLFKPVSNWQRRFQTFVGRDGYNIPDKPADREDPLSNLGFKKRGDTNQLSIEAFDSTGKYVIVQSTRSVEPDAWYHVAAVSDGATLTLFVKGAADREYVREASAPFHGAMFNGGRYWTIGRGCFTDFPVEQFFGLIDEVRITAAALPPSRFLTSPPSESPPTQSSPSESPPPPAIPTTAPATQPYRRIPPLSSKIIHVHDPAIVFTGESYHLFASHEGYQHWRSKDLIDWQRVGSVFSEAPEWARRSVNPRVGMWAPEIVRFGSRYHVYYAVSTWGSQRSAIGLAVNESLDPGDPKYKWIDKGKVVESFPGGDDNCIDATVSFDAAGRPWLAWGSFNKGIYAHRLDAETGMLSDEDTKTYHLASRGGTTAMEAPYLFSHDGWYFLCVSYDFCARGVRSTYKLMIGRSRQISGPYVDRAGRPMLEGNASLLLRSHEYHIGPGQASVVKIPDAQGGRMMLAHHYYDGRNNGVPALAVRPLYWDDDGWPIAGEPIVEQADAAPTKSIAGRWIVWHDYARPAEIGFGPDGAARGPIGAGRWQLDGERLLITWPDGVVDRCFLAADHESFIGRRSDGTIVRGVR